MGTIRIEKDRRDGGRSLIAEKHIADHHEPEHLAAG